MELALWSLLGPRPVTMLAWDSFGAGWVNDVVKQLKLDARVRTADYGRITELGSIDPANDIVFTWNGTTSGVRVPDADWIAADAPASRSATRHRLRLRRPSTGRRSMSARSAGKRRSAARPATACWCCRRARLNGSKATRAAAAAEDLPADQKRRADRRHLQGRNDQHAVDARGRGLAVRARLGRTNRRPRRAHCPRRRQRRRARPLGAAGGLDRASRGRPGDSLQHLGMPAIRRPLRRRGQRGAAEGDREIARG